MFAARTALWIAALHSSLFSDMAYRSRWISVLTCPYPDAVLVGLYVVFSAIFPLIIIFSGVHICFYRYVRKMISVFPWMGDLRIFFFYFCGKKKPEPGKLTIFLSGTLMQTCHSSRFLSTNLEVSRFHVWKSQVVVLFRNWKNKKASHFVACPMSPSPQSVG